MKLLRDNQEMGGEITSWHSYPSIYALGHRYLKDLFLDDVIVEEKIDGSQFSFGKFLVNGNVVLRCRSKGCDLDVNYPQNMFSPAVNSVKEISEKLSLGWTYRGEFLSKPKHNSLCYDRTPKNHIIIFDINTAEEEYIPYEKKLLHCESLGLECVPKIYEGKIEDSNIVLGFLDRMSILGGQKIEGIVIKNYSRFGIDKKALMGKYVSEAFKEVHCKEWKDGNPQSGDIIQRLILEYKTPARWNKTIQHLKESGNLDNSPKDIGLLIKECQDDISKECVDEISAKLWTWAKGHILRGCVGGMPEWYKEQLLKNQFQVKV